MGLSAIPLARVEILFLHFAALEQVLATFAEIQAPKSRVAFGILAFRRFVETDLLGLKQASALLDASAEATKQGFEALSLFSFYFDHGGYTSLR
jgi:hypothetical protein